LKQIYASESYTEIDTLPKVTKQVVVVVVLR